MEAVNFLMLPLPAPLEVLCFRVHFLTFGIFCFRFQLQIELVASEFASPSSLLSKCFRFHKKLTASTASVSSFHFLTSVCNSCDWLSTRFHKLQVTLLGLLGSVTSQLVRQPQQTKKEPIITTSWPLLATVKPRTLMPCSIGGISRITHS